MQREYIAPYPIGRGFPANYGDLPFTMRGVCWVWDVLSQSPYLIEVS